MSTDLFKAKNENDVYFTPILRIYTLRVALATLWHHANEAKSSKQSIVHYSVSVGVLILTQGN